ncbi:Galactokinase [Clostridiaceae bacterium JG1575]|nr:Galactokinase [Clostridiaceae bacterium JG1575]
MNTPAMQPLETPASLDAKAQGLFGPSASPFSFFFSPGRVNLIGEHLDYNGGHVLPCAINRGNYLALRPRADRTIRAFSENFPQSGVWAGDLDQEQCANGWFQFLYGALRVLPHSLPMGFDLFLTGNLPNGAGLSSSASVSTGILYALNQVFHLGHSRVELALLAQQVENRYIGVQCGIMDQYAILMGEADAAIYLNTQKLSHETVPFVLKDLALVISNTNKKRTLAGSAYNDRRRACELAAKALGRPIAGVRPEEILALALPEDVRQKALYVAQEEERSLAAAKALKAQDLSAFASLMNASHAGLRDLFQVTGPELDALSWALRQEGAPGARMTGAGFGGCTVALVPKEDLSGRLERAAARYQAATGLQADHYLVVPSKGTGEL